MSHAMTIHEKLHRLTRYSNRSAIARAAGLAHTYLHTMLARKSNISADAGVALAGVLEVDGDWLMDDSWGWPPVRKGAAAVPQIEDLATEAQPA